MQNRPLETLYNRGHSGLLKIPPNQQLLWDLVAYYSSPQALKRTSENLKLEFGHIM